MRRFVEERVVKSPGDDVTSAELGEAYVDFCVDKFWHPVSSRATESALADLLLEVHRVARSNSVRRDERSQRGWRNVSIVQVEEENENNPF